MRWPWSGPRPDDESRRAAQLASEHVRRNVLGAEVTNAQLRAREPERLVFAVFFRESGKPSVPGSYRLTAVGRLTDAVEDLETTPTSPYWIRGLK